MMNYFEQTRMGQSKWWTWIGVTYLTFVGWVFFQSILMAPIPSVAGMVDPEVGERFAEISAASWADIDIVKYGQLSGLMLLATLAAVLSIITGALTKGTPRLIAGILAAVSIPLSIYFGIVSNGMMDSGPLMGVFNKALGVSPLAFGLFLLTFPAALITLYLGQKFIHRRSIRSLHTAASKVRWRWMLQGFGVTWVVLGSFALIGSLLGVVELRNVFGEGRFWAYAAVSLLLIPFQAATEEIVFRGYFVQGLTHILRSKWVAFFLTSLGFMALHLSNPEALSAADGALPIVMSGYFAFGFAACLLVLFDDGLETAIGVHAGNNCFAAIVINYDNSVLPTPSIFRTGTDPVKDSISTIVVLGVIVLIFWWLRRGRVGSSGTPSNLAA